MRILRRRLDRDFTILGNELLRDRELSFRARGVLAFLLSHSDGWSVDAKRIADGGPEGRDAIRTAMRELVERGYVQRSRVHDDETGQWRTETAVRNSLLADFSPTTENPTPGPAPEFPASETRTSADPALQEEPHKKKPEEHGGPRGARRVRDLWDEDVLTDDQCVRVWDESRKRLAGKTIGDPTDEQLEHMLTEVADHLATHPEWTRTARDPVGILLHRVELAIAGELPDRAWDQECGGSTIPPRARRGRWAFTYRGSREVPTAFDDRESEALG